jgi:hypothetical protein
MQEQGMKAGGWGCAYEKSAFTSWFDLFLKSGTSVEDVIEKVLALLPPSSPRPSM